MCRFLPNVRRQPLGGEIAQNIMCTGGQVEQNHRLMLKGGRRYGIGTGERMIGRKDHVHRCVVQFGRLHRSIEVHVVHDAKLNVTGLELFQQRGLIFKMQGQIHLGMLLIELLDQRWQDDRSQGRKAPNGQGARQSDLRRCRLELVGFAQEIDRLVENAPPCRSENDTVRLMPGAELGLQRPLQFVQRGCHGRARHSLLLGRGANTSSGSNRTEIVQLSQSEFVHRPSQRSGEAEGQRSVRPRVSGKDTITKVLIAHRIMMYPTKTMWMSRLDSHVFKYGAVPPKTAPDVA